LDLRAKIAGMNSEIERLGEHKEPESKLKKLGLELNRNDNPIKFFQDKATYLAECCRKTENEIYVLRVRVETLGRVARLMWIMTITMSRHSDEGVDLQDRIQTLKCNMATLGEVARLMHDIAQE
jgi:hypothetical protein